jgi:hypothetical protein
MIGTARTPGRVLLLDGSEESRRLAAEDPRLASLPDWLARERP